MAESATSLVAPLPLSQPLYWSGLRHRKRLVVHVPENALVSDVRIPAGACGNAGPGSVLQPRRAGRKRPGGAIGRVSRLREGWSCRCEGDRKKCQSGHGRDPLVRGYGSEQSMEPAAVGCLGPML